MAGINKGVAANAIDRLYELICGDPNTLTGGVVPTEASGNHVSDRAPRFVRYVGTDIINRAGQSDRVVRIRYQGHDRAGHFGHPVDNHWFMTLQVDIHYTCAADSSHEDELHMVMADDTQLLDAEIGKESNLRSGTMGYRVISSAVGESETGYISSIFVEAQILGV